MGLGKTISTLTAIKELKYYRFQVSKVLVIAPKKVAESTWDKEIEKWEHTKGLKVSKILGPVKQRLKALYTPADIYIINRDNVTWLVDLVRNAWPFDMVIVDESSSFKSHKAKRFKSLAAMSNHIKRLVLLTGTPSPNGIDDLWSQIYLIDQGERLEKRYTHFRERYFNPDKRGPAGQIFSYEAKDGAGKLVLDKISDICMSMEAKDYLTLPDRIYNNISVAFDTKARKAYDELEKELILQIPDAEELTVTSAAALSNKLLQLANGAVYDENHNYHEIHDCKLERLAELVEGLNGEHALIFYNFQHDKSRILNLLRDKMKLNVRELSSTIDVDEWNAGRADILLTHPASSAYGLNLQSGGHHVIWFGLTWNLELYQQANARLHRQGQEHTVFIHHLISENTRDEDVMAALDRKEDTQQFVIDSLKARIEKVKNELL